MQVPGAEVVPGRPLRGFSIPADLVNSNILIVQSILVPVLTEMKRIIPGAEKNLP